MATRDFAAFHDLVAALRDQGLTYVVLDPERPVPPRVRVVITTAAELGLVGPSAEAVGAQVVVFSEPRSTVASALQALAGKHRFARLVIGIDPGERPGVAVLGDGLLVAAVHAASPEAAAAEVDRALASVPADSHVVRIGHGAPTQRDRILLALHALNPALRVEIVDETRSTPMSYKTPAERDTAAAAAIALARGAPVFHAPQPRPSAGEVRDIQRKSRVASEGRVTISRELAHAVALGELTLDEALRHAEGRRGRTAA